MKPFMTFLQIAIGVLLFLLGAIIALNARHLGLNSWREIVQSSKAAILGAPPETIIRFTFDAEQFGNASLYSASTADLPLPSAIDPNIERLSDFSADSDYRRLASSVLRLDLLVAADSQDSAGADKRVSPCSATLIAEDKILTARHCVTSAFRPGVDQATASLRFGYFAEDAGGADEGVGIPATLGLLDCGRAESYDFAVLELSSEAARAIRESGRPSALMSSAAIENGQDLFVIHHPLGDAMHLSRRGCRAGDITEDAPTAIGDAPYFSHSCGTMPGTSGAPIFDDKTRAMVGIHVQGSPNILKLNRKSGSGIQVLKILEACPQVREFARISQGRSDQPE